MACGKMENERGISVQLKDNVANKFQVIFNCVSCYASGMRGCDVDNLNECLI